MVTTSRLSVQQDNALLLMKAVAEASSDEEEAEAIDQMRSDRLWINESLRRTWTKLPVAHMRVWKFRMNRLSTAINTNNGIESNHHVLKHVYLAAIYDKSLLAVLTGVLDYFKHKQFEYIHENVMFTGALRCYKNDIPKFLVNGPKRFIDHCMNKRKLFGNWRLTGDDLGPLTLTSRAAQVTTMRLT